MIKRILINIILSFVILPVITPFLMYIIGITFGYNILEAKPWYSFWSFFQIHWGGIIAYCSFFILVLVFGIYNLSIVVYFNKYKRSLKFVYKLLVFFILLFALLFISGKGMFFDMGNGSYYLKLLLLLLFTSTIMVYLHYLLIDKKAEKLITTKI